MKPWLPGKIHTWDTGERKVAFTTPHHHMFSKKMEDPLQEKRGLAEHSIPAVLGAHNMGVRI